MADADDTKLLGGAINASALGHFGRVLYGIPFVVFGLMHFGMGGQMTGMVPGWLPGGILWVYVTGVALLAGGIAFIIRKMVVPAGVGLAALLLVFILTVHLPMLMGGEMQQAMPNLLKDFALAGGALVAAAHAKLAN